MERRVKWRIASTSLTSGKPSISRAHVFGAERFGGVDRGDVEFGQLVGLLAGRTALEQQRLVLREVAGDFRDHAHLAPAGAARSAQYPCRRACVISVAQSSMRIGQFGIEPAQRQAADDFLLQQRLVDLFGRFAVARTTNSLKNLPLKRGFSLPAR